MGPKYAMTSRRVCWSLLGARDAFLRLSSVYFDELASPEERALEDPLIVPTAKVVEYLQSRNTKYMERD